MPRSTADIDLVIDPDEASLDRFLELLDPDRFYVPADAARQAFQLRDQFNVIDHRTGWKLDLIIRKDRPFSEAELARRQPATVAGVRVAVATAEDTILTKLEWATTTGSERQLLDVVDLLRSRADRLDSTYLDHWATELGVDDALHQARTEAEVPDFDR